MIVKCVVACVNANGSSDLFFVKVDCTPEDYEQGRHCEAAELYACNQDYGEPMVTFDPNDPPGESLMDLFVWETASCINLDGEEISPPAQVEASVTPQIPRTPTPTDQWVEQVCRLIRGSSKLVKGERCPADDPSEVVVELKDGCTLRSGVYEVTPESLTCGEYVRVCDHKGEEVVYWDSAEWEEDPVLVMGAIIRAAAGARLFAIGGDASAQSPAEKLFEVWTEGYQASGDSGVAEFHGKFPGTTFEEAVAKYRDSLPPEKQANISLERMTNWGCKFFDNEADARRRYG